MSKLLATYLLAACSLAQYLTQAPLPYALDALEPAISEDRLQQNYAKRHQAYIISHNELVD